MTDPLGPIKRPLPTAETQKQFLAESVTKPTNTLPSTSAAQPLKKGADADLDAGRKALSEAAAETSTVKRAFGAAGVFFFGLISLPLAIVPAIFAVLGAGVGALAGSDSKGAEIGWSVGKFIMNVGTLGLTELFFSLTKGGYGWLKAKNKAPEEEFEQQETLSDEDVDIENLPPFALSPEDLEEVAENVSQQQQSSAQAEVLRNASVEEPLQFEEQPEEPQIQEEQVQTKPTVSTPTPAPSLSLSDELSSYFSQSTALQIPDELRQKLTTHLTGSTDEIWKKINEIHIPAKYHLQLLKILHEIATDDPLKQRLFQLIQEKEKLDGFIVVTTNKNIPAKLFLREQNNVDPTLTIAAAIIKLDQNSLPQVKKSSLPQVNFDANEGLVILVPKDQKENLITLPAYAKRADTDTQLKICIPKNRIRHFIETTLGYPQEVTFQNQQQRICLFDKLHDEIWEKFKIALHDQDLTPPQS